MSRRRYVGPGFWESDTATRLTPGARLLLIGSWTLADDEGLLSWDPALLRELLYPSDFEVTDVDVTGWMSELAETRAVLTYTHGPLRLGYITGFEATHKTGRPKPSTLPPPNEKTRAAIAVYLQRDSSTCHVCGGPATDPKDASELVDGYDLEATTRRRCLSISSHHPSNICVVHKACKESVDPRVGVVSRLHYLANHGALFDEVDVSEHLLPNSKSQQELPQTVVRDGIAALTEPSNAALTTKSVSKAGGAAPKSETTANNPPHKPLTCTNVESLQPHRKISEAVVSTHDDLTTTSPTEREMEREREREEERETLSASRSCTTGTGPQPNPTSTPSSAFGAGNDKAATTRTIMTDLSPADVVLEQPPQPAGGDDVTDESQESLFAVSVEMVQEPTDHAEHPEPETWTPELKTQAHAILKPWWATHGDGWTQTYKTIFRAVITALTKDVTEKKIVDALEDLAEKNEHITIAALVPKRQRAEPKTWTTDRKAQAHTLLKPWWAIYGNGWPQTYGVVFGVIVAALSNKVTEEDLKRALMVLGPERKPISGGTIGFALSRSSKQVAEDNAFAAVAASRSADKYTQRTL